MASPTYPSSTQPSYEELLQQLLLLQQEMASLKLQQQTASSVPSSGSPPPSNPLPPTSQAPALSVKVAAPDPFDGTQSKADTFISQLQLYFYGKRVHDDSLKIVTALSYMKEGTAGPWAKLKVKWLESLDPDAPVSWETFVQDFKKTFGDPNPGGTARHKISQLK